MTKPGKFRRYKNGFNIRELILHIKSKGKPIIMLIYAEEVLIKLNTHHDETAFSKVRIEMI